MNTRIGILDYGMGNISSVLNALTYLGIEGEIIKERKQFNDCSHLIIPGVGSYHEAMSNILKYDFLEPIREQCNLGKPLLGICLGMQLLSELGEEGGQSMGLGLIPGNVEYLDSITLPIPHVGWNSLNFHFDHPLCEGLKKHVDFYFVHSYYFNCKNNKNVLASVEYGREIPAIVVSGNVIGTQFHPEKSQENGLLLIENFCNWDGLC